MATALLPSCGTSNPSQVETILGPKVAIFGGMSPKSSISYQSGWHKRTAPDGNLIQNYDYRTYNLGVFGRPGIVWFVTPKLVWKLP